MSKTTDRLINFYKITRGVNRLNTSAEWLEQYASESDCVLEQLYRKKKAESLLPHQIRLLGNLYSLRWHFDGENYACRYDAENDPIGQRLAPYSKDRQYCAMWSLRWIEDRLWEEARKNSPLWEIDPFFINPYKEHLECNDVRDNSENWDKLEGFCSVTNSYGEEYSIVAECSGWDVDVEGNITNRKWSYEISHERLREDDWILHLSEKKWFDYNAYLAFKCAYRVACGIAGVSPVKQTAFYSNDKPSAIRRNKIDVNVKTYLMHDANTGYTKIGKSINPRQRERTLQSEKPTITLMKVCDRLVEKQLHAQYADKRIRGEWFDLSEEDIADICSKYKFD